MKNIISLALLMLTVSHSFAAEPSTVITAAPQAAPCSVYVAQNNIVVENTGNKPAELTITGKYGTQITKTTVSNKKQIPVKELQEGRYIIKIKTDRGIQTIKLDVL